MPYLILQILIYYSVLPITVSATPEFRYSGLESKWLMTTIQRAHKTSIVVSSSKEASLMRCSTKCGDQGIVSLYYSQSDRMCYCNNDLDTDTESLSGQTPITYGYYRFIAEVSTYEGFTKRKTRPMMRDCLEAFDAGLVKDGVYVIQPTNQSPTDVWCDMHNGGWTVFQRRQDGSVYFFLGWDDYVSGFGYKFSEYWIGLDNLHALTTEPSELHLYLETFGDRIPTDANITYSTFSVGSASQTYVLRVGGFSGTCGHDAFVSHGNGDRFSTYDRDHDRKWGSCAGRHRGAWWYGRCHRSNLNGLYVGYTSDGNGVNWAPCWGNAYSLKKTVMKLRRK